MGENLDPANQPIHCGRSFSRIGGELITAGQCFDALGRLLLLESDADNETLLQVLDIAQLIQAWRDRISDEQPKLTAAERNHQ